MLLCWSCSNYVIEKQIHFFCTPDFDRLRLYLEGALWIVKQMSLESANRYFVVSECQQTNLCLLGIK